MRIHETRNGEVIQVAPEQARQILAIQEGQFHDLKRIEIAPGKLTKTLSAFANSDGGEIYIGIDEIRPFKKREWRGFPDIEAANGHLQAFQQVFPLGEEIVYSFLRSEAESGFVLKVEVFKSRQIRKASNGLAYYRFGAQDLPVDKPEIEDRLRRNKGLVSFETELLPVDVAVITRSPITRKFIRNVVPTSKPEPWLRKQQLIQQDKPIVAGVLLFAEEPQAVLPKRCGIKLYRYKTREAEGSRATLAFDPKSIEGCAYEQIHASERETIRIVEEIRKLSEQGLEEIEYPPETLHEIITNAVLHRDYSIQDDIHIRIFDNRIEVESPGTLPGHVTVKNILNERYSRNGALVRIMNKFPDPPNKDVGEGLNTAFTAMTMLRLKPPVIEQRQSSVLVNIRHERLASPEEAILDYLIEHKSIANKQARELCSIGSENSMKGVLQRLVRRGLIEVVPGTAGARTAYQRVRGTKPKRGRPRKRVEPE
jgi:ATP-dependent DNA helicase RecG